MWLINNIVSKYDHMSINSLTNYCDFQMIEILVGISGIEVEAVN